jgi:hypothetical protein
LAKRSSKSSPAKAAKAASPRRARRPTLGEWNTWITANHGALLKKARSNCIRLTGKPTFGGTRRKKSA